MWLLEDPNEYLNKLDEKYNQQIKQFKSQTSLKSNIIWK